MSNDQRGHAAKAAPGDRNERPAGWFAVVLAIVTTTAIVAVAIAAPLLVEVFRGLAPGGVTDLPPPGGSPSAIRSGWWHLVAFQTTCIVLAVLMADQLRRDTAARLAWRPPSGRLSWVWPFIVTTLVSLFVAAVALTYYPEVVARDLEPIRQMVSAGPLWLAFLALAVGAPISEELLFRGFLLQRLKVTPLGFWGGALVANIGWTALHVGYSWLSLADVFTAGLLFSWALWRTGSIWVPIAFHAIYNAVVFFIMLIPEQGATAVTATAHSLAPW
jgi:hypothetical protein